MAVAHLSPSTFAQALGASESARLSIEPARGGVLSWNTHAPHGRLSFRLLRAGQPASEWMDYAQWQPTGAKSLSPEHDGTRVEVEVIAAARPFDGIEARARDVHFELLAFSSPVRCRPSLPYAGDALILDVPARTQYVAGFDERGWCSPATLSMIHAYHGIDCSVPETAREVFDRAYN